jgi:hypothetical protein
MSFSASDETSAWLSASAKEACRLAIATGFCEGTQIDLGIIREAATVYAKTGFLDRSEIEGCVERLRSAASKAGGSYHWPPAPLQQAG